MGTQALQTALGKGAHETGSDLHLSALHASAAERRQNCTLHPREFTKLSPSTKLREKDFRTHMFTKLSCCCHPHHQSLCGFCPPEQQQGVTIRHCCTHQHLSCSFPPPPPPQQQGQLFSRCLRLCSSLKRRTEWIPFFLHCFNNFPLIKGKR